MTLAREPGSEIIAQFTVPKRGTWLNTAAHTVPLDAVYDSMNVFIREGKLRRRPALELFNHAFPYNAAHGQRILGGGMGVNAAAEDEIYVVSYNRLYVLFPAAAWWQSFPIAGGSPNIATNDGNFVVDVAFIETSSTFSALFAFTTNPIKVFSTLDSSIASVTGTNIPNAKSICIAASRVIALVAPHTVVWSKTLNYTNFDALAIVKRAQTGDAGICVRSLTALSFVLYKEYSIHTARAQAGLDEGTAFAFAEPIIAEGPAGIYAVVDINGTHMYMTKSGRIAIYNGTSYPQWVADGIWFYLQQDIKQSLAFLIRGVYDYRLNTVVFYYPRNSDGLVGMTGVVVVNLPFPGFEAEASSSPHAFLGISELGITHACTRRFDGIASNIERAFVFTTNVGENIPVNYLLSETATADGTDTFTSSFQTGLQAVPDAIHMHTTVETFVERGVDYGDMTLTPVTSNMLETPGGTVHTADAQTIDLETLPVNEYVGFNKQTRFFGLKYSWSSLSNVRYSGAVVYSSTNTRQRR